MGGGMPSAETHVIAEMIAAEVKFLADSEENSLKC
jgi:hypothetical protein